LSNIKADYIVDFGIIKRKEQYEMSSRMKYKEKVMNSDIGVNL